MDSKKVAMDKCETCKYWLRNTNTFLFQPCERLDPFNEEAVAVSQPLEFGTHINTHPTFGCIHHEEIEQQ